MRLPEFPDWRDNLPKAKKLPTWKQTTQGFQGVGQANFGKFANYFRRLGRQNQWGD